MTVVDGDGHAFDEFDGDIFGFIWRVFDGRAPIEDGVVVWFEGWRFYLAAFTGDAPHIFVCRIGRLLGVRHGDVVLLGVRQLFLSAHTPLTYWC